MDGAEDGPARCFGITASYILAISVVFSYRWRLDRSAKVAQVVEELILIWTATEAEEWSNRIFSLPL
jgi:hypothetical protein